MPKYRSLTMDELQSLEKEFVDFLVVNGITADDWTQLKEEDPERAEKICDSFSDVVFEKILRECQYIERHLPYSIVSISCGEDKMQLRGLEIPKDSKFDLTRQEDRMKILALESNLLKSISSYKPYGESGREKEIFEMLNQGFFISDSTFYDSLA